jgi:GNAT superfamily N-acetyltransferase
MTANGWSGVVPALPGDRAGIRFRREDIPEMSVGVRPGRRGRGIGTDLLNGLIEHARSRRLALSLSVQETNPALRLYQRLGFRLVRDEGDGGLVLVLVPEPDVA